MLFNTFEFFVFFSLVLIVYFRLPHRGQNILLLVASYVFYGWWDYRFCLLLLTSTVVDYRCGMLMARQQLQSRRKLILMISLVTNLGLLGVFKYFNFFIDSAVSGLEMFGFQANWSSLKIILPVGISFYTFQTLSYTIDIYRRKIEPTHDPVAFALFVSFFPQLVAGPIERAQSLLPRLEKPRHVTTTDIKEGVSLIIIGLVRKVAIADIAADQVDIIFGNPGQYSSLTLLLGLYLFSLQIYCDFAGYSNIARGTARLMGIELMQNFNHPYLAISFSDFWQRWHISLSQWLRDYLYIPLGGNRCSNVKTQRNLMVTMLLGGLWHGANWTFIFWGLLHGTYLALGRIMPDRFSLNTSTGRVGFAGRIFKRFVIFHSVALTWIFFRSRDFPSAWQYLKGLAQGTTETSRGVWSTMIFTVCIIAAIDLVQSQKDDFYLKRKLEGWPRTIAYALAIAILILTWRSEYVPFIYFQF